MTWRITDQDFNMGGPGRTVVTLGDDTVLSIITSDRDEYIRDAQTYSVSGPTWEVVDVQADPGEYEVALVDRYDNFKGERLDPEPHDWAAHAQNIDGWVYTHVTGPMIEALVAERGLGE